jgi:predicted dehydrogenase
MKKVIFLGCENSHADTFLRMLNEDASCADIQVVGVYSDEHEAAENLGAKYTIPVLSHYAELVGQVDGVVITARHGKKHYEFAKPYIESGCPMFIDKPITTDANEATEFMNALKDANVAISGGSCLIYDDNVQMLKAEHDNGVNGKTIGGMVCAPVLAKSVYGGFYFYAQHLTEMVCEIFGRYPLSVQAFPKDSAYTVVFHYQGYDVTGIFVESGGYYYTTRLSQGKIHGVESIVDGNNPCFRREFDEWIRVLRGGKQHISYEDFFAPVFVMDAIVRSIASGKEEKIVYSSKE